MRLQGEAIRNWVHFLKTDKMTRIFLVVLLFGIILRFYGLHNAENTDEYNEVIEALRVASGKFNLNRWWKKGYQNILAVEYGIYFVGGYLLQIFQSPMDFAAKIIRNMEPLFLIGRFTTATMGSLSIVLLYTIGRKLYNGRVALIAAALLSVSAVHVWTSHLVNTDIPLTFFFLLSFYFITRFYDSGIPRDYAIAAFFGAFAINMKIMGVGIGLIFLIAHFIRCRKGGKKLGECIWSKEIFYSTAGFLLGLIISNPAILIGFKQWVMHFVWQYGVYTNVYEEVPYAVDGNGYYTYLLLMGREFGLPLFWVMMVSLIYAIYKREDWDYILIIFVIALFMILASTDFLIQDRYLMTMLPALFLLTARFLDFLITVISGVPNKQAAALLGISSILMLHPSINSVKYVVSLTEDNTSKMSKKWIEENIPAGSKILMDAGRTIITAGPRLNQSKERLEEQLNIIKNLKEGETFDSPLVKIVDSYSAIYFELMLKNMPEITYHITSTELGRKLETVDYYKENKFDYFIQNETFDYRVKDPLWREKFPKSAAFYDSIDKHFTLIKTFSPSSTRNGPVIKIYKVTQTPASIEAKA